MTMDLSSLIPSGMTTSPSPIVAAGGGLVIVLIIVTAVVNTTLNTMQRAFQHYLSSMYATAMYETANVRNDTVVGEAGNNGPAGNNGSEGADGHDVIIVEDTSVDFAVHIDTAGGLLWTNAAATAYWLLRQDKITTLQFNNDTPLTNDSGNTGSTLVFTPDLPEAYRPNQTIQRAVHLTTSGDGGATTQLSTGILTVTAAGVVTIVNDSVNPIYIVPRQTFSYQSA